MSLIQGIAVGIAVGLAILIAVVPIFGIIALVFHFLRKRGQRNFDGSQGKMS